MRPYFDTNHLAGPLLLVVTIAWGAMELSQFSQGLEARKAPRPAHLVNIGDCPAHVGEHPLAGTGRAVLCSIG